MLLLAGDVMLNNKTVGPVDYSIPKKQLQDQLDAHQQAITNLTSIIAGKSF